MLQFIVGNAINVQSVLDTQYLSLQIFIINIVIVVYEMK